MATSVILKIIGVMVTLHDSDHQQTTKLITSKERVNAMRVATIQKDGWMDGQIDRKMGGQMTTKLYPSDHVTR